MKASARKLVVGALGVAVLILIALSVLVGARAFTPAEVGEILALGPNRGPLSLPAHLAPDMYSILWDLRIPRTLLAAVSGASLALAGALTQAWTKNPLADPGIIGVNAGAGFAVALGITLGLAASVPERIVWGLVGALLAAAIVLFMSQRLSAEPLTLVLVGVGVTFTLQAAMSLLSLYSSDTLEGLRRWSVGTTAGRGIEEGLLAAVGLAAGAVVAALAARPLDLLAMGEEVSRGLGGSPTRARVLAAAAVIILAGTATATVGMVIFLGFAVPHLVRPWTGPALTRMLLPVALLGAAIALAADIVGRFLVQPGELDMSIVITFIGAPMMVAMVRRRSARGAGIAHG